MFTVLLKCLYVIIIICLYDRVDMVLLVLSGMVTRLLLRLVYFSNKQTIIFWRGRGGGGGGTKTNKFFSASCSMQTIFQATSFSCQFFCVRTILLMDFSNSKHFFQDFSSSGPLQKNNGLSLNSLLAVVLSQPCSSYFTCIT